MRLMQLIDRESFPDEGCVSRDRVRPFVIRTEKRNAIDADGQPLFKPRVTRLQPVAWQARHGAQQRLYEAVTDYVRHGYNQALAAKQRHIGFLMILMQRLVTSSTAAIRTTLERRQALLNEPQPQVPLFDAADMDEWAELDGQTQVDIAVQTSGWVQEKAEVDLLLTLARETEAQGTDAKAEALLELIYKLQQEENDPTLKVLIFTEFVPTQAMLAGFLESRGFSVVLLNGSMDLDTRAKSQQVFSQEVRILVSTDAGGEGLNLQFCHVIVNFDMPWNPMRIEQRIGRVDRIGQRHVVRAINFVLEDTVEHRVRQVLETKLEVIAQEFGVDKASDVMDSVDAEPIFDELFLQGLQDPASIEKACDAVIDQVRDKVDHILKEFPEDVARLWIAADPDDVLLDEQVLARLRERGFELMTFEDSVAFRAEYENLYRSAWDEGKAGPAKALILHLRGNNTNELPWDYLKQARLVSLSLANVFPKFSYPVLRQIGAEHHEALFAAQARHASQVHGEAATKEFILTHIFRISPHLLSRPEDFWRELLRLHYRDTGLPMVLAEHVAHVLSDQAVLKGLPIAELFSSKSVLLRLVQEAWYRYLSRLGIHGTRIGEESTFAHFGKVDVPFEHPDVRVIIDAMFLDGLLHPLAVQSPPSDIPEWARVGIIQDPLALRNLVAEGLKGILQSIPTLESSYRDWASLSRRFGEVIARFHALDSVRAEGLKVAIAEVQSAADEHLRQWVAKHYADLPSLPVAKGPVMVHHVPRYLAMRRAAGELKVALLVFDGLAVDQWVLIRETLARRAPKLDFEESACFAWLPTLTSVSRQALFSGLKPREFADTIETTAPEPAQWSRFWQDQGLRANEVFYRKGIKRNDQLTELDAALSGPSLKIAGLVVDTVDEIVHGAVLGKRGIANQIEGWCETGFLERLFMLLIDKGFHIYLTADHGNVEALGQGRPNQGVAPEMRGERVRTYRSETLVAESAAAQPNTFRLDIAGLPANFMALFAGGRTAFLPQGEPAVVHGGISVEELLVPFVKISRVS